MNERLQWFLERIGYFVYTPGVETDLYIMNEAHAHALYANEQLQARQRYFDTKEEAEQYKKSTV